MAKVKKTSAEEALCRDVDDCDIVAYATALKSGGVVTPERLEIARVLMGYVKLREDALRGAWARSGGDVRNCDVMVTPAALRKGWERRCEYGTPCCPFEYALAPFDRKEGRE